MIRALTVSVFALALNTCPGPDPADGYATINGNVTTKDGKPLTGSIMVVCGLDSPGQYGRSLDTNAKGEYQVRMQAPELSRPAGSAAEFVHICGVTARTAQVVIASRVQPVIFAVDKSRRVTTTINLIGGQVDP